MNFIDNIIVTLWIVFMLYWLISSIGVKKNARGSWSRGLGMRVLIVIVVIVIHDLPGSDTFFGQHAYVLSGVIRLFGILVCALGISFAVWARRHLGKNWGAPMSLKENPELVTSGPYAYVRHPIYTGFLVAMLGSALASGIFWLVMFVVFCIYFSYTAKVEDSIMLRQFPDQYPTYKARTKMLIPLVL